MSCRMARLHYWNSSSKHANIASYREAYRRVLVFSLAFLDHAFCRDGCERELVMYNVILMTFITF